MSITCTVSLLWSSKASSRAPLAMVYANSYHGLTS
eukprot:Gb_39439 [translate_table: standard]